MLREERRDSQKNAPILSVIIRSQVGISQENAQNVFIKKEAKKRETKKKRKS